MPQPRYNTQAQVQPPNPSIHSLLSSQPGVSFNPNKPAFIPSPSGPHGNIAAAHLQSLAASHAQAAAQAQLQAQAQAALHLNLQSLNAKIVQAQQLALINGISVDEVLRRMGGLSEQEVGLLKLCVAREQEERLKVQAVGLMSQQQQQPFQAQTRGPLRTTSPPNIILNSPPPSSTSATSAQEQRAAARLKVEQNLRARCGKEQQAQRVQAPAPVQSSGGWEEAFAKMNISLGAEQRFSQGQGMVMTPPQGRVDLPPVTRTTQPQVSSPIVRSFSPANSAHSASSDSVNVVGKKDVGPTPAQNKHVQAVSWRAVGKLQQAPVSPAASPLSVKLTAQNAENAVKSFNGVFGNKVITPSQTTFGGNTHAPSSPTRLTRSGSGSSGSGHSSIGDEASVASFPPSLSGGRRRRSSGSCDTGMTTPVSEGESGDGDKANYFGSKNLQVHGRDETYPLSKVSSKGSNASVGNSTGAGAGVIGQGYPGNNKLAVVQFSAVIRQPHGPPGGADELGNKNFASRIRQKAVSDLSVLGRRVAQRSPTVPSY